MQMIFIQINAQGLDVKLADNFMEEKLTYSINQHVNYILISQNSH